MIILSSSSRRRLTKAFTRPLFLSMYTTASLASSGVLRHRTRQQQRARWRNVARVTQRRDCLLRTVHTHTSCCRSPLARERRVTVKPPTTERSVTDRFCAYGTDSRRHYATFSKGHRRFVEQRLRRSSVLEKRQHAFDAAASPAPMPLPAGLRRGIIE